MFEWNSLFSWTASGDLSKTVHEFFYSDIVKVSSNNKSCWSWIKYSIPCFSSCLVLFVVVIKGSNQTRLLAYTPIYFKMIKKERSWCRCKSLIKLIILTEIKIQWLPKKICLANCIFFWDLMPIASLIKCLSDLVRVISLRNRIWKVSLKCLSFIGKPSWCLWNYHAWFLFSN